MDEEYGGAELDAGFEFRFMPYAPGSEPPAVPERPTAHISKLCRGCPYPAHGFVCWSRDGDCMRKRIGKLNNIEFKECDADGAGAVEQ